jgi:hypothetical protein
VRDCDPFRRYVWFFSGERKCGEACFCLDGGSLNSPFWVMHDIGFLKQEGFDGDMVYIASSPTAARATLAGDVVVSGVNSQVIADAVLQGGDLVAMGSIANVVALLCNGAAGN